VRGKQRATGNVALLFTNQPAESVLDFFRNWMVPEFARGGHVSPTTIVLNPGPLEGFPTMMLDQFRKLGLIAEIENGKIMLREPYAAAQEGEALTHEQCKLLEKLDVKLVNFTIVVDCYWSNGEFQAL
jgi:mRNA turnover protein 4